MQLETDESLANTILQFPETEDEIAGVRDKWPLNAAVSEVASEVKIKSGDDQSARRTAYRFLSQNEQNAVAMGTDFSSFSTSYDISDKIYVTMDPMEKTEWFGNQQWIMTENGLVGLLEVGTDKQQKAYNIAGTLRLVSGRNTWGIRKEFETIDANTYKYGDLIIKFHETNYSGGVKPEYTDTYNGNTLKTGRISLLDKVDDELTTYEPGTMRYFIVEIIPRDKVQAQRVEKLSLDDGLRGFLYEAEDREMMTIHNLTDSPIQYQIDINTEFSTTSVRFSEFVESDLQCEMTEVSTIDGMATQLVSIPPQGHILVVSSDILADHESNINYYEDVFLQVPKY